MPGTAAPRERDRCERRVREKTTDAAPPSRQAFGLPVGVFFSPTQGAAPRRTSTTKNKEKENANNNLFH
ncbi:hypothetical protein [Pandoravirus japonicus]|uniref:Uncharacterized protein n=1 Tax=Pandoravirus japonicus TaxID=2823154 RepID=A0A811BN00_9VIRU|nr:hypothetical protein [Pandoravirus japonicus]